MKNSQKEFQMISLGLFLLFKNEGTVILSEVWFCRKLIISSDI